MGAGHKRFTTVIRIWFDFLHTEIYTVKHYRSCLWLEKRCIFTVVRFQSLTDKRKNFSVYEVKKSYHGKCLNDFYSLVTMHQKTHSFATPLTLWFFDALLFVNKNRSKTFHGIICMHVEIFSQNLGKWRLILCPIERLKFTIIKSQRDRKGRVCGFYFKSCFWKFKVNYTLIIWSKFKNSNHYNQVSGKNLQVPFLFERNHKARF